MITSFAEQKLIIILVYDRYLTLEYCNVLEMQNTDIAVLLLTRG